MKYESRSFPCLIVLLAGIAVCCQARAGLLADFSSQPNGATAGRYYNAAGNIIQSTPLIDAADGFTHPGCVAFEADCTDPKYVHGSIILPITPADVGNFRYVRVSIRTATGTFFRLGFLDSDFREPRFDDDWATPSNVHLAGPWGTYETARDGNWNSYEIDLANTVPAFDRHSSKLAGFYIEIYGQGYPLWGGSKGRFTVKIDDIQAVPDSIFPAANQLVASVNAPLRLPLLVGGEAHGAENIRILADLGLGNFVWIPSYSYIMGNTPWSHEHTVFDDVDACVKHGFHFWVSGRRGLGDHFRGGGFTSGGHGSGEWYSVAKLREIQSRGGQYFLGALGEELDADLIQEGWRPSFRARLPELLNYTDPVGGRVSFEGELTRMGKRYQEAGIRFFANLCITHHHSGFRSGADVVIAELFEHLPTTELQLAYLRGGSQQFDRDWGVWFSPWYHGQVPCADKELWPVPQAQPEGGHTAASFRRALYLSYVSGARLFVPQNTEPLYARKEGGGYELVLWGRELKQFWDYVRQHESRVEPILNLAVLMDQNNGWEPPFLWHDSRPFETVWGILPVNRRPDGMFRDYLNVLLPGFMRTLESVKEKGKDIFPGYFAATPLGPFDIVASDISPERLAKYPVVVLLGGMDMTPSLKDTLRTYVRNGGTLLINALQMYAGSVLIQDEEFLGVKIGSDIDAADRINRKGEVPGVAEESINEPWFASLTSRPITAEVLAVDNKTPPRPVLLSHNFGKGRVYLSTPEYMMEGYGGQSKPLGFFCQMLKGLSSQGPFHVESEREVVSWIAAKRGGDILIALANHDKTPVKATIYCQNRVKQCVLEAGTGSLESRENEAATELIVQIPAEDVMVVAVK